LGKSEVCGLAGNPLQAFGPPLAKRGFVVLCPDSICFEDRRTGATGILPLDHDGDFLQHYNEMCYRILKGDTLMRTVISDAMAGIDILQNLPFVDQKNMGTLGHSYGGNTVLFLMPMDKRIRYGCASGSACTFQNRMANGVRIEMASVIPHFKEKYDIDDLVKCMAPNKLLIVSAEEDPVSKDADFIYQQARPEYIRRNAGANLQHQRYPGGHALTQDRFDYIVNWLCDQK
jgi:dienelactone hydrolase